MRKVIRTTVLPAPADRVWALLQRPETFCFVSRPILEMTPVHAPFPSIWSEGDYEVSMRLFGVLPVGRQHIVIELGPCDDGIYRLRDAGHGALAKTWHHQITVEPRGGDEARYSDEVTIDAGWLTAPVAAFARLFYAYRQHRLRRLVRAG